MARNPSNNVIFGFKKVFVPLDKYTRWRKMAKETLKLSRDAQGRLEWIIWYETTGKRNVLATCRHFHIAPKVFYTWKNRFDGIHLELLEDRSKAPKKRREKEITTEEEMRIVDLRKRHIRWGKEKLAVVYQNTHGHPISSWKIQYTIMKYKLYWNPKKNHRTQAKRRRSHEKKRITELQKQPVAGYLIALDTIVIYWNGLKRYILTAIDTTSKIAFARMYTSKSSKNAADFLRRMVYLLGEAPLHSLTDNGSEFHKEFETACRELGIAHYWSRKKTPTDNSVDERFNKTVREEFLDLGNFTPDPLQFNRAITEWLIEYTFVRPDRKSVV